MADLSSAFAQLLGRQPQDHEIQQLYRVRDALGLRENDALWLVLLALEHYRALYEAIPAQIESASKSVTEEHKQASRLAIEASVEATKRHLAEAVAQSARQIARNVARKEAWQWLSFGLAAAASAVLIAGWAGFVKGREAGEAAGYAQAREEKAAASWAATPEGKLAFRLARAGDLESLATCDKAGWVEKSGFCYAQAASDGKLRGWKLP